MAADSGSHKFQAPKGLRDFYPAEMAARRYVENIWREVSINHGFEEVEGPTFEHVELYTHKSGPGIVSEIFGVFSGKDESQVADATGGGAQRTAPYALRPEFTPTLARMVAARANALPMPVKWFAIPSHFRAERPQRGRLAEFVQWNVDFIGDASPRADAEVIAVAVAAMERLGLTSSDVRIKLNDRFLVDEALSFLKFPNERWADAYALFDRRSKLSEAEFVTQATEAGFSEGDVTHLNLFLKMRGSLRTHELEEWTRRSEVSESVSVIVSDRFGALASELESRGIADWCELDISIVRGLAYYTGTVFEIHEATGAERAIAGGGRYDKLIESFGGPSLPACGFGMGDVVLSLVLQDKGLLTPEKFMEPLRPDVFVIAATDAGAEHVAPTVAQLRKAGLHARHSYKSTRNPRKLLEEAGKARSRFAVMLSDDVSAGTVEVKDLDGGTQDTLGLDQLADEIRKRLL